VECKAMATKLRAHRSVQNIARSAIFYNRGCPGLVTFRRPGRSGV